MAPRPTIVWFRRDLRLADQPALAAAVERGRPVVPVFVWSPEEEAPWAPGAAHRWWLHQSLACLAEALETRGSRLILRAGAAAEELGKLAHESGADAVFWNRRYEPAVIARDGALKHSLRVAGVEARSYNAALLHEPWEIATKSGGPFQVFTPFWRASAKRPPPLRALEAPSRLSSPQAWPASQSLKQLELEPRQGWAGGLGAAWTPGESGAQRRLTQFLAAVGDYATERDRPDRDGGSRLSPHLHFGELSPRQIWHAARDAAESPSSLLAIDDGYLRQLYWREFAHHLLFHFPKTPGEPLRPAFAQFPWRDDPPKLRAWQHGQTGYPIVDAGMRELWTTGWMHNRVRMIVASFLVKDLLLPWQAGARWFWDTLVDADLANNTLGWQWTAGCGADAAPYFRIFNPVSQGRRFDPDGRYVRRWVPELAPLPDDWIHAPWEARDEALRERGVDLDTTYPRPLVDHRQAREIALAAFAELRQATAERLVAKAPEGPRAQHRLAEKRATSTPRPRRSR